MKTMMDLLKLKKKINLFSRKSGCFSFKPVCKKHPLR